MINPYYSTLGIEERIGEAKPELSVLNEQDYLFSYAPSILYEMADGMVIKLENHFPIDSSQMDFHQKRQINCSKIINSKGEEVYIYICNANVENVDSGRMNPFLAFEEMNDINSEIWNPTVSVRNNTTKIDIQNLEKGTYFFNWWDVNDSLNKSLTNLWELIDYYEGKIDQCHMKSDSIQGLRISNKNEEYTDRLTDSLFAEIHIFCEIDSEYEKKRNDEFLKIIGQGFGNLNIFEKNKIIQFEIRGPALKSHKIDDRPISPEELIEYRAQDQSLENQSLEKILSFFSDNHIILKH